MSPVKTMYSNSKTEVDKIGQTSQKEEIGFKKIKACFVCKSTDHLIKDCDFYAKKCPEPKLKTVANTSQMVVKPVYDNAKRVNHQKISNKYTKSKRTIVPSGVLTRKGLVNPVRPNGKRVVHTVSTARPISSARLFAPKIAQNGSDIRPIYPRMDNGKMDNALKKSRWVWRPKVNYIDHESKEKGSQYSKVEMLDPKGISKSVATKLIFQTNEDYKELCGFWKCPNEVKITGKPPSISFMRPFGYPLTILNTLDPLGKFDGKSDEGYLLGYSTSSKAFRVYNKRTKRVEESLHIDFLEDQPNVAGNGTQESYVAGSSRKYKEPTQEYILLPLHPHRPKIPVEDVIQDAQEKSSENAPNDKGELDSEDIAAEQALKDDLERMVAQEMAAQAVDDATRQAFEEEKRKSASTKRAAQATSINKLNTGRPSVNTANTPYVSAASTPTSANAGESSFVYLGGQIPIDASTLPNADPPIDPNMPDLEDVSNAFLNDGIFSGAYDDDDVGAEANFNNMDHTIDVSPIPTLRIHKVHPKDQILGDPKSAVQTRGKIQKASSVQQALFKLQKVWVLVDLPYGKKVIGTKWVFRNKRDERSIVVKNKARHVAQGFRHEEGIDYDEVFSLVAKIEAIRLFLAFASYMGFTVYQMDVKSAFLYGTIREEVYVQQPGFVDPAHPNKVYKVIKALYGLHQAPRAWYETLSAFLLENGFWRGTIDKTLFIKKNRSDIMLVQVYVDDIIFGSTTQSMCTEFEDCMHKRFQMSSMGELTFFWGKQQPEGIFISQDKYIVNILKKFDFCSIKTTTTHIESNKPLVKDEDGVDVDVHIYRSMIGSLMYLTASRPDIMFAVCAYARFQVTPKASHLNAIKPIFRYLKYQPKLGLWYPRDSPFKLEAFSDSDYGGASLDRKSTTGGCQFFDRRLISWQCKKQTIVANSTTEAEYVIPANCCGKVLWIQNQMMDYGFNFINTKIHIDNESTICIVKNPVYHSRTKHIEIRHHFIRDCYEKRLIDVVKIHTDNNVADLLTKGFDVTRFNFLVLELILLGNNMDLRMDGSCASNFSHIWVFWTTAKSRTVNNTSYIDATVAGKPVTISEASIRSDFLFDDADGIDSLNNQAIFDTIQLMGNQLKDVPVPLDHFPVATLTKKVLTFMVKKGKNFLGKVTPLFDSMLVQQINDEGDASERLSDSPPIPSPPHPSEDQPQIQPDLSHIPSPTTHIPNSIPEGSGGNHGGQSSNDASLSRDVMVKKLKKGVKPLITHHKSWMKTRLARKTSLKKKGVHKEYVSKQGRKSIKSFKGEPSAHKDLAFDDLDNIVDDTLDYMEFEDAQDEGRTSSVVLEEKENADKEVSTEAPVSTVKPNEGTDKKNEGTDKQDGSTDSTKVSTDRQGEGTADQNEGKILIIMSQNKEKLKEKEKGVEIRNIEDTERPMPTSTRSILTLRPLPKIDPKDKGKKRIEEEDESDTESEGKNKCRQEFLLRNSKRKKVRSLPSNQMSKNFFIDTIAAQGNSWLTKKHYELKIKTFEEIQVLYERLKRQDQNFVAIRSAEGRGE
ncbi:putative ribonuclease H-like domain-containing protein [Tanacetum coccineum]